MNIKNYRNSFTAFLIDSDIGRATPIVNALNMAGYVAEMRLNRDSLFSEITRNPPHIILMNFRDQVFFSEDSQRIELIEKIQNHLPEVHIVILCEELDMAEATQLYQYDIYDCVLWPTATPINLLRAIDRAAECDYYMYLSEQLRDSDESQSKTQVRNFSLLQLWMKEVENCRSKEELVNLFLHEAVEYLNTDLGIYLQYIESQKTLVVVKVVGPSSPEIKDMGIDLTIEAPDFLPNQLLNPDKFIPLQSFVMRGLSRNQAVCLPLKTTNGVDGIFVIPPPQEKFFGVPELDSSYLSLCLSSINNQMRQFDLKNQLEQYSVFDTESNVFRNEFICQKLKEEVSRSRRIFRPVTAILLSLDYYEDMALKLDSGRFQRFLKSFTDILVSNSRLNDIVGRLDRDQFVICLPHTDLRGGAVKAERFRRIIENADFSAILKQSEKITVSLGISEYPSICHDSDQLLNTAEQAMFNAKKSGNNCIAVATVSERFTPDFMVQDGKNFSTDNR